jgi:hypothetical protein
MDHTRIYFQDWQDSNLHRLLRPLSPIIWVATVPLRPQSWSGHRDSNPGLNLGKVVRYQLRHVRISIGPSGRIRTGNVTFHGYTTYQDYLAHLKARGRVGINVPPLIRRFLGLVGLTGVEPARPLRPQRSERCAATKLRHSPIIIDRWKQIPTVRRVHTYLAPERCPASGRCTRDTRMQPTFQSYHSVP